MHLVKLVVLLAAVLAAASAHAQQRNPWGDLLDPRATMPPPQRQQQPPGGIQTAPLPAPGQRQGSPETNLPPQQPAQKGRPGTKQQPGEAAVERPPEQKVVNPTAIFSGLDKITGRIFPFEVAMDETVQFGALQVTPRACYTRPPTEPQNTTGFIEVDEITLDGKTRRIFNGWMFAASPGLNAVEHAIYDVWLVDCKQGPPDTSKASG
jgi:hypothetical protein